MIESIAVPMDGSLQAESVLPYVSAIAQGLGANVTLLHAIGGSRLVTGRLSAEPEQRAYLERLQANSRDVAERYLDRQASGLEDIGVAVETTVLDGHPSQAIIRYEEEHRPDFIAVSTQGRSGTSRVALGSVAGHLLNNVRAPLLLVHPDEPVARPVAQPKEIVVPLDTSELAEAALPMASYLARGLGASVTLVSALPTISQLYLGSEMVVHPTDVFKRAEEAAGEYLEDVSARLTADGLDVTSLVLQGDPARAIFDYTRKASDAIVVMATHGRSGLGRWVLGSVTDKVVREGGAPAVIVRPSKAR